MDYIQIDMCGASDDLILVAVETSEGISYLEELNVYGEQDGFGLIFHDGNVVAEFWYTYSGIWSFNFRFTVDDEPLPAISFGLTGAPMVSRVDKYRPAYSCFARLDIIGSEARPLKGYSIRLFDSHQELVVKLKEQARLNKAE